MDKIRIKKAQAIAQIIESDSKDYFNIAHISNLSEFNAEIKQSIDDKVLTEENTFEHLFPDSSESFFYMAVCIDKTSNQPFLQEMGIGRYEDGTIIREKAIAYIKNGRPIPATNGFLNLTAHFAYAYAYVTTYVPTSMQELASSPYCAICTSDENTPDLVRIEKNSILGRLSKSITSIPINSLFKNIKKLFVKMLSCDNIELKPSKRLASEGILHFNKDTKNLEFFNGKEWLIIQTSADNK